MLAELSAQRAAAGPAGGQGGASGRAAGDLAGLLARLPLSFLPGPAGLLRSRGDGIAAEAPRGCVCAGPAAWRCRGPRVPGAAAGRAGSRLPGGRAG